MNRQDEEEVLDPTFLDLAGDGGDQIEAGGGSSSVLIYSGGGTSEAISTDLAVGTRLRGVGDGRRIRGGAVVAQGRDGFQRGSWPHAG